MFKSEKSLAKRNATLDSITFTVNGKRELLPLEKGSLNVHALMLITSTTKLVVSS